MITQHKYITQHNIVNIQIFNTFNHLYSLSSHLIYASLNFEKRFVRLYIYIQKHCESHFSYFDMSTYHTILTYSLDFHKYHRYHAVGWFEV